MDPIRNIIKVRVNNQTISTNTKTPRDEERQALLLENIE